MPDDTSGSVPPPSGAPPVRTTGGTTLWTPPSPEHLQRLLPQYEIIAMLGRGGMGAVYQGRQISLDRLVAIKILPPEAIEGNEDAGFTERFKNEARSMAKMNHPAIVSVYDFGETSEGQLYFVMEFVDGTDVAKMILSQGRLPPEHALAITAHVCDALHYAHSHGVIHRDIKPANVLMNMEGQVKIADFGLAKATDPGATGITRTNMAMGTPDFIAPEATITGVLVDHRADLYALGVMLYNMLTGKVPRGVFAPASKLAGSDPRFDAIIMRAMQTEREDRYQSAMELRRDLDVILTVPEVKEAPAPQRAPHASKPVIKGPGRTEAGLSSPARSGTKAGLESPTSVKKSSAGMIAGVLGAVVVLGVGAFFAFNKPKPAEDNASTGESQSPPSQDSSTAESDSATRAPSSSPSIPAAKSGEVVTFGGHRYQFIAGKHSWTEGKTAAEAMGGHLATITSKAEDDFLSKTFYSQLVKDYDFAFIGGIASPWKWVTEEEFAYKPEGFNSTTGARMLSLSRGGGKLRWADQSTGTHGAGIIVEWGDDDKTKSAGPIASTTKPGEVLIFGGHRYQLVMEPLKWDQAKAKAESLGGHLATITSQTELDFIHTTYAKAIRESGTRSAYIGAMQEAPGAKWKWVTGEPLAFNGWWAGEPNRAGVGANEMAVACILHKSVKTEGVGWDDTNARNPRPFLVEWDDDGKTKPPSVAAIPSPLPATAPYVQTPATGVTPQPAGDLRLAQLDAGFKTRYETDVQKPFLAAVAALNQSYVANGIARARAAAQQAGLLDDVTALDAEKMRVEKGEGVPAEDGEGAPVSLTGLRKTYRDALSKFTADRDRKAGPLYDIYLKSLDGYIADLTKADKLDEARKVKTLRDEIAAKKPDAASPAATTVKSDTPKPGAPAVAKTPEVKPSSGNYWRDSAKWLVANGGTCKVKAGNKESDVKTEKDIPPGKFDIVELSLDRLNSPLPSPTDEDFKVFNGIKTLRKVNVRMANLRDEAFVFLAANPDLTWLHLEGVTEVADGLLTHLAGAKKLQHFSVQYAKGFTGAGLEKMPFLATLTEVDFLGSGISDDCVKALAKCKQIKSIRITAGTATDAGFATLRGLKTLTGLTASTTAFGDEAAAAIAGIGGLASIDVANSKLTDAGLAELRSLKKLTLLNLSGTQVTKDAAASFQKALPQCRVSN